MAVGETLLRSLLRERHLTRFPAFEAQFRRAAKALAEREGDPGLEDKSGTSRGCNVGGVRRLIAPLPSGFWTARRDARRRGDRPA
jgi:hypothetical protein